MARPSQRLAQSPVRAGTQSSAALGRAARPSSGGSYTERLVLYIDGVRHEQTYDTRGRERLVKTKKENG